MKCIDSNMKSSKNPYGVAEVKQLKNNKQKKSSDDNEKPWVIILIF